MKYDAQLGSLKNDLLQVKNILIILPPAGNVDRLAAALSLMLALEKADKKVVVVTEDTIKVAYSNLYGIGAVKNSIPKLASGNLTITLEGVVAADGTVPTLEKLDWYPEGSNLNLVFHVVPGQRFEPTKVSPKYPDGEIDLIFILGAKTLNDLGNIYPDNQELFNKTPIVVINNNPASESPFGKVNIIDTANPSLSEMVWQILQDLSLNIDSDLATNIITGIYDATSQLTTNLTPGIFATIAAALQSGAKLPNQVQTAPQPLPQVPIVEPQPAQGPVSPINQWFNFQSNPNPPAAVSSQATQPQQSAQEEKPMGEIAVSGNPEMDNPAPDWLTPKIFKGGNVG